MFSYEPNFDIATSPDDVLVNTVNCVGVMGAGVAKAIREAYPSVMEPYKRACDSGRFAPGTLHLHRVEGGPIIVNLATKLHWKNPSRIDWVGSGLLYLSRFLQAEMDRAPGTIRSVTLPPPGCGHGGLDWSRVHGMVRASLAPVAAREVQIRVTVAEPEPGDWEPVYAGVGARDTPDTVLQLMRQIACALGERGYLLRSGGARGADTAFETGARVVGGGKEIFLIRPDPVRPDAIVEISDTFERVMENFHPKPSALSPVARSLMTRNGAQVFGANFDRPADVLVCWTPGGRAGGGTGQAIRLAQAVGIPVLDLGRPDLVGMGVDDLVARITDLVAARREEIGFPALAGGLSMECAPT